MRNLLTLAELLPDYQAAVRLLRNEGEVTIDQGIDLVVAFYQQVRIGSAIPATSSDEDMLLFQYGSQNWYDGRGEYFGLDITRQVIVEEEEEQLIYQLSLEFEFDPAPFSACPAYNCWSPAFPLLAEWVNSQKATLGFKLAQTRFFRDIQIGLQRV